MITEETTWLDRLQTEFKELDAKLDKLDQFIGYGIEYPGLSRVEQTLLTAQRDAMRCYAAILQGRIDHAEASQA